MYFLLKNEMRLSSGGRLFELMGTVFAAQLYGSI
jgi:hypothetical protein